MSTREVARFFIISSLALMVAYTANAQDPAIDRPLLVSGQEKIDRPEDIPAAQLDSIALYIESFSDNTQLSIAMLNDTLVSFLGFIKRKGEWRFAENRDSVFEIGSITKVFTSALLALLISQDLLGLDDPVSGIFPFPLNQDEMDGKKITFKTLSNHSSGLPRLPENIMPLVWKTPENPYRDYDHKMLRDYLEKDMKLLSAPGSKYMYSNLGMGLLAYLIELKTNKSYEDLLLENIFSKYRMSSSTTKRSNISSRLVRGRNQNGEIVPNWDINALKGAGAILSTTADLMKFVKANINHDSVLERQRESTFTVSENLDMALGWHILKTGVDDRWHWHNGGTGGYRSQLVMDVENRKAVIILSNVSSFHSASNNIDQLGFSLQQTLRLYDTFK